MLYTNDFIRILKPWKKWSDMPWILCSRKLFTGRKTREINPVCVCACFELCNSRGRCNCALSYMEPITIHHTVSFICNSWLDLCATCHLFTADNNIGVTLEKTPTLSQQKVFVPMLDLVGLSWYTSSYSGRKWTQGFCILSMHADQN